MSVGIDVFVAVGTTVDVGVAGATVAVEVGVGEAPPLLTTNAISSVNSGDVIAWLPALTACVPTVLPVLGSIHEPVPANGKLNVNVVVYEVVSPGFVAA